MPELQTQLSLERARVRDLLRYYTPAKKQAAKKHGNLLSLDCDDEATLVPSIAAAAEIVEGNEDDNTLPKCDTTGPGPPSNDVTTEADEEIPDDSELLAHDPTLMAFTQLGAFRLNCERSFISLMDGKHQYIIAEATRSVSLNDPNEYDKRDPGEKVYLGARVLDMHWGVCPNTIQVFTALDDSLNLSTDLVTANKDCYVMNDLSAIPAYTDRPYVAGWPHMRFYAEVPIHSPTGYVIGTYCVVDNKPRDGLDKKGLDALNEIASAIMNHLALVRMQHGLQRAGKMVKGLGLFVEENSSPQAWINPTNAPKQPTASRMGTVRTLSSTTNQQRFVQESSPASTVEYSEADLKSVAGKSVASSQSSLPKSSGRLRPRERKLSLDDIFGDSESALVTGIKMLCSRASELIQDAIDLDGVLFIDACFHDIAVNPNAQVPRTEASMPKDLPEPQDFDLGQLLKDPILVASEATPTVTEVFPTWESQTTLQRSGLSDVLGYSLREKVVLGTITSSSRQVALPQSTVHGLLRQYRHGHIFVLDEDGSLAQNAEEIRRRALQKDIFPDIDAQSASDSARAREQAWAKQLIKLCVSARAIIFFPLWDPQRDQWFAGGLAWTNDPTKILQPEDITYLSAFGNCIMAEKSRLDALTADRAKADFISSVSHELRSPLHGVLASAEALQETSTGFSQDDMIRTITVCGEVLLDTMDQILDYAKMNHSTNPTPSKNGKEVAKKPEVQAMKETSLDLSTLVERVVEGIFAGHSYRQGALIPTESQKAPTHRDLVAVTTSPRDIMIILSIDWQASWIFKSQVGGWKRILMNLFGNALKYTETGFVHISLRANPAPTHTTVTLQIDDSGRGMSKDYMKYEMFTPFAQEDHMSVGTGLGLSIVRQLVTDLGGTINIESEKGYGTSVKVSVALETSENPEPELLEDMSMVADMKTRCQGRTLCLIGFEYYPDIGDTPTGILTAQAQRMLALKSSVAVLAVDWFGMHVTEAPALPSASGDVLIGLQSELDFSGEGWIGRPLIVFENVALTRPPDEKGLFSLAQPVGPHKLARILGQCLQYIASIQKQKAVEKLPITAQNLTRNLTMAQDLSKPTGDPPNEDSIAVVEDIDQKTMQGMRIPTTVIDTSKGPSPTLPLPALKAPSPNLQSPKAQVSEVTAKRTQKTKDATIAVHEIPRRSTVLLVEDNIINMKILMNYMKNAKQQFVTAANGLEALQQYQANPQSFKVIFMDISMPIMDGLTSTRQMRLHERENLLPRTRIVALTCFSSAEYQRDALLSGIDVFLIKPVPMKNLRPILELDPDMVVPNVT